MTQAQLAVMIGRTAKYISEVETGRARLSESELKKLAVALGVSHDKILEADPAELDQQVEELPRRIREAQPTGMVLFTFQQLIDHLDRAGWLRSCKMWNVSWDPFPEESDVTIVEQLGNLVETRSVRLLYLFPRQRLEPGAAEASSAIQGTTQTLPASLADALRWSATLRTHLDAADDRIVGYAMSDEFPLFSPLHSHLWVETADTSWSEVMPLLYGRAETRTHENSNASVPFWYHVPRDCGSRMLYTLAQCIKRVDRRPISA
jgi:transcriptional regulator with XRE-family HTH domain